MAAACRINDADMDAAGRRTVRKNEKGYRLSKMLEEVTSLYEAYLEEFYRLERNRKPMEGAFGFGGGPQHYPCHNQFAGDLEQLLQTFGSRSPSSQEVGPVLQYIYFTAPDRWKAEPSVYWMLMAVHGLTLELVRLTEPSEAAPLYNAYQRVYPRRSRLPVQKKLAVLLKERAGA